MKKILDIRKKIAGIKMSKKLDQPMEIQDKRNHGYFTVDNLFIDEYVRLCGVYTSGVYLSLCRHANRARMCWPSIRLISEELDVTARRVIAGIRWLGEHGVIKTYKERGKSNIYELSDKAHWKKLRVIGGRVESLRKASQGSLDAFRELNRDKE